MRRLAPDDRAERDDAGIAPRLRERHRGERQLERARNGHHRHGVRLDAGLLGRLERSRKHAVRQAAVEARDDDRERPPVTGRRSLEDRVAVGNVDLAAHVLDAHALLG